MLGFLLWIQMILNLIFPTSNIMVCVDYSPPIPGICGSPKAVEAYEQVVEFFLEYNEHSFGN